MIDVAFGNDFRPVTSHSFVGTLNKSWGAHALKGGAEIRMYGERSRSTGNDQSGRYQFTNAYTRQNSASGTDYFGLQNYAAFLLGLPSTTSITAGGGVRRVLHHLGVLRAGRLAGQRQADAEPRPALRGREPDGRAEQQERVRLRLRLRPADPGHGPGALRRAERPRPEGARAATERQGRPQVRRRRRRPAVQDAEEHVPAARRLRLPVGLQHGPPRRHRAVRRASSASGAAT